MASNYTSNYGLCQWEASDKVLRTEFNADNAKIDAALVSKASTSALNSLKSTVNTKADKTALSALQTTVNTKADKSALDSLKTTVDTKADKTALNALSQTVTSQGAELELRNCAVHFQSYTGTGASSRTFTFSSQPFLVLFSNADPGTFFAVRGFKRAFTLGGNTPVTVNLTWSGNSVTISDSALSLNKNNYPYSVLALLEL